MRQEPQTIQIGKTLFPTTNTKLAAALLTVDVPFADPQVPPLSNVYSEEKPYRPGMPSTITYHLGGQSAGEHKSADLARAFEAGEADRQLDALVDEIESANPVLGNRLRKLLPAALVCYCRGALENRERLLDLWRKATPMVLVRKGQTSFALVARNASDSVLRHCGL